MSDAAIDEREWVAWGFANLTLPEAIRRLRAVNVDRKARGDEPLGEPPFTGPRSAASGFELTLRRYADYAIRHRLKFNDGRGGEIEVGPSIIALLEMADLSVDFHGVDALVGDPKPGRHVPPCTCFNSPDKVEPLCPVHGDGVAARIRRWLMERKRRRNLRRTGWTLGCPSGRHGNVGRCNCTERDA